VVVVVAATAASRRHRAVSAGLLIHFARDIAEGPPGVRMLWPLSNTAWTVSARWFWAMIIGFTVVRLTAVTLGIPRMRIRLFQGPVPVKPPLLRPLAVRPQVIAIPTSRWRDPILPVPIRPRAPEVHRVPLGGDAGPGCPSQTLHVAIPA
jgi:hypothetical protein